MFAVRNKTEVSTDWLPNSITSQASTNIESKEKTTRDGKALLKQKADWLTGRAPQIARSKSGTVDFSKYSKYLSFLLIRGFDSWRLFIWEINSPQSNHLASKKEMLSDLENCFGSQFRWLYLADLTNETRRRDDGTTEGAGIGLGIGMGQKWRSKQWRTLSRFDNPFALSNLSNRKWVAESERIVRAFVEHPMIWSAKIEKVTPNEQEMNCELKATNWCLAHVSHRTEDEREQS